MTPTRDEITAAMRIICDAIGAFHERFGVEELVVPAFPDYSTQQLRKRLEDEEYNELRDAEMLGDLVGVLDGVCDLIYVLVGRCRVMGLPLPEAFAEVHSSNFSKLGRDGKPVLLPGGKVGKAPDWCPPRIAEIIRAAGGGVAMS